MLAKHVRLDSALYGREGMAWRDHWAHINGGDRSKFDPKMMDSSGKSLVRYAEAAEIADAVAFLASPRSKFINGQALRVDGGETLFSRVIEPLSRRARVSAFRLTHNLRQ